ncbi:MAG: polyisoprenoid-binding protein [Candidatus Dadabacteria bacterium]|nr:MAG: polyisoprenoid-binding protein [Candidatus Dadabacteria bacterium]
MFKHLTITIAALAALLIQAPAQAETVEYAVDPAHTYVGFEVSHLMVSKVQGQFKKYDGLIRYDASKPEKSYAEGTIRVASIDTDNKKRDDHLRSPDFFDAEKYPEIKFHTTGVKKKGNKLIATGELTIKGVTKKVEFPVEVRGPVADPFQPGKQRIGLSAELTINRQDFGIRWNKTMEAGGLVVGNDVRIILEVEAISQ